MSIDLYLNSIAVVVNRGRTVHIAYCCDVDVVNVNVSTNITQQEPFLSLVFIEGSPLLYKFDA